MGKRQESGLIELICMICVLTTSEHHPVFSSLNSLGAYCLRRVGASRVNGFLAAASLFTEIASEIFVLKEKLKRRPEWRSSVTQSFLSSHFGSLIEV